MGDELDQVEFHPIDLERTKALCQRFEEDSFICSFGDSSGFHESDGLGGIRCIESLRSKLVADPACGVHLWQDSRIVGMLVMGAHRLDPSIGHVFLYYLIPEVRGTGLSQSMDDHAVAYLKGKGYQKARLCVSPTNTRAIRFYERRGWVDIGVHPTRPTVHLMEKPL